MGEGSDIHAGNYGYGQATDLETAGFRACPAESIRTMLINYWPLRWLTPVARQAALTAQGYPQRLGMVCRR